MTTTLICAGLACPVSLVNRLVANLRKTIIQQVEQNHPNLSPIEKQKLLNNEVNKVISKEGVEPFLSINKFHNFMLNKFKSDIEYKLSK